MIPKGLAWLLLVVGSGAVAMPLGPTILVTSVLTMTGGMLALGGFAYIVTQPIVTVPAVFGMSLAWQLVRGQPFQGPIDGAVCLLVGLVSGWGALHHSGKLKPYDGFYAVTLLFLLSALFSLLLRRSSPLGPSRAHLGPGVMIAFYLVTPFLEAAITLATLRHVGILRTFLRSHYRCGSFQAHVRLGLLTGVTISLITAVAVAVESQLFGLRVVSNNPFSSPSGPYPGLSAGEVIVLVTAIVIIAPVVEEALFRGLLFGTLAQYWPIPWASLVAAGLFAGAHLIPSLWIPLVLAGLLLNAAYRRSQSLIPSMIAHATFNGLSIALAVVALR